MAVKGPAGPKVIQRCKLAHQTDCRCMTSGLAHGVWGAQRQKWSQRCGSRLLKRADLPAKCLENCSPPLQVELETLLSAG